MMLMGFIQHTDGLLASRFWLGLAEAGLFPGVNYYLSCWYKRSEFGIRAVSVLIFIETISADKDPGHFLLCRGGFWIFRWAPRCSNKQDGRYWWSTWLGVDFHP